MRVLKICLIAAGIVGGADWNVALAQDQSEPANGKPAERSRPDYDQRLISEPENDRFRVMWRIMAEDQCVFADDGCNVVSRFRDGPVPYLKRGVLTQDHATASRTYLVLEARREFSGYGGSRSLVACPKPPKYTCIRHAEPGYDLNELVKQPVIADAATDRPNWIGHTEIHGSWVDLASPEYAIGCLSLDLQLLRTHRLGDFPSRIRSTSLYSLCRSAP
ncbi:hypothetical protein [Bosea sp. (in: a-proteobacteria)]|uniref:hypothetical protein n=1 Tax=Bosea sp. (in: a-proteobacteria) TaxID=1871050 RepID=UPI003F6E478C